MNDLDEKYISDVKSQLSCNVPSDYEYISYCYTNEVIDENRAYFILCRMHGLSSYKALLFFTDFFNDFLGVGLSGEINGKRSRIDKIDFSGFALKKALVSYPDTTAFNQILVNNDRNGSIGGDVLKRFNWFLDYKNKKFYFKKNNLFSLPFEYNMSGIEIQHAGLQLINQIVRVQPPKRTANQNEIIFDDDLKFKQKFELKPIFSIHAIRKDSPAEKAGLQVGDKILKINNKQAHQLTMQWIMDLFQSKDGKWISILVERNGEQIKYKFQLKKIL